MRTLAVVMLLVASPARALVLGGGDADKDCRVAFDGVDAGVGASGVVCRDGDPACDADGVQNGTCRFVVRVCVGVSVTGCAPVAIDRMAGGGVALPPPLLPATEGVCGDALAVDVGAIGSPAVATLRAYRGNELREVDYLNLCCAPETGLLEAAACGLAFDPAGSGCVDVPERAGRKLARARELLAEARSDPARAPKLLRKAAKQVRRLRGIGRKMARRDDCGFALGLMASHAEAALRAAAGQ